MQKTVFLLAQNVPRLSPRVLSTTGHFRTFSRLAKTRQYIETFHKDTRDPIWRLVNTLRTPGRLELSDALRGSHVSMHTYYKWKAIISQHDVAFAVEKLEELGYAVTPAAESASIPASTNLIPSWVVLYLIGHKVRTPAHAMGPMLDLVYDHLRHAAPDIQGPMLILATFHLARFNLLVPMRRILDTFLNTPLPDPDGLFNFFLQAISATPYRSVANANNVVAVLKAMEARQLKLNSQTYEALLNDRFVTLQLTKFLQARMVQEGFVPKAEHLEAYLRVFANNGAIHDAQKYLDVIHSTPAEETEEPPHVSQTPYYRGNTIVLGAHDDRASAFEFLRRLINKKLSGPNEEQPTPHLPTQRREVRFVHKPKNDIYDQTAALHVAAKDLSTTTHRLIQIFLKLTARPTIATHTVLIRGLLFRKEFSKAEVFWSKLLKTGLAIDKEALTTGVQTLTRNGNPHAAFQLLEKYAAKPGEKVSETSLLHPSVPITTVSINEFLVSLKRISRPDAVFRLWDYMDVLYGNHPNTETLSILLQSARLACRMDDTLSGAIAEFKLINPFRRRKVYQACHSREEAVDAVLTVLGHPSRGGLRRYTSGIWKDQLPIEAARKIFLQALFGNDPSGRLLSVTSPASALRNSYDADASSGIGLPKFNPKKYVFTPPPDLLTSDGKSHHPHIVVTNANCFNYITLLGVAGRVAEIPLVLAWMKELGIQPSDSTVAVALVFWGEVSAQAPLVERWSGGPEKNEYSRLVDWIRDWVGEMRLPHGRTLYKWQGIVKKMRESAR
ncbi:hypothetical protein B0H34DRAFT_661422 [Crassisporium funariophilum]|nr:hypothetical protein B0H34DRAFT_661422 [Crassisporium funariophilum]